MTTAPKTSVLIQVYGTDTCKGTSEARRTLDAHNAPYEYVDIERNVDAGAWVESVTGDRLITPVIDFYGKTLIQPDQKKVFSMLENSGVRSAVEP